MKKASSITKNTLNKLTVILFFLSGLISLNILEGSLVSYVLGIIFLISAIYGFVCISKNKKFIF